MSAFARAKLQVVSNGSFGAQPRSATIITLHKPQQNSIRWWVPVGVVTLIAGIMVGTSWGHGAWRIPHISLSLSIPDLSFFTNQRDPEANAPYAETINPPPADVVIPIPIVADLPPSAEKIAGNSPDLSAGIALPASSLQVPDPDIAAAPKAAEIDPVTVVAAAIADAPAALKDLKSQNDPPSQIEVRSASTPAIGRLIDDAKAELDAGDNEGALADYNRVLARDRHNRAALMGQAYAAQQAGDYATAVKADRALLAIDPDDDTARVNLVAALGVWQAPQALKELQHQVETRPDLAPAQMALADVLVRRGDVLGALKHAQRASELEPDNPVYMLGLAVTYDKLGHSSEAVEHYRQVLKAGETLDGRTTTLPVSRTAILQRTAYLEKLMASAENLAAQQ